MLDFGERLGVMVERLGHNLQVTTSDVGLARLMSRWIGLQRLTPPLKYLSTAMDPVADPDECMRRTWSLRRSSIHPSTAESDACGAGPKNTSTALP